MRTGLTLVGLTTVLVLVLVVIGFIRGLEVSLARSGDPDTAIVFALGMGENLEYSSIPMRTADLVSANIPGIGERYGRKYVSAELYLGTEVYVGNRDRPSLGLVRGVTPDIVRVRRGAQLESGRWPGPGEVLVGTLVATKLGVDREELQSGAGLKFEGKTWRVSGEFSAAGAAFESEVWCGLDDLQQAMQRQDLSMVAMTFATSDGFADLQMFCKERTTDLRLQTIRENDYYALLQKDYGPIRMLAWLVVALVSGAGVFAGLNTMYAAALGRAREMAVLQTIGFARPALVVGLVQEGVLLSAAAGLLATLITAVGLQGAAVRFTMGAFALAIDGKTVLIGCALAVLLGVLGTIPPAIRTMRMPIVEGLKAV
ncbi:MAG: ABC transporter permease [Planctomycetaceae bacterium]|nr:ABC transporter permease [Planctomycetaceae bacterium]